MVDADLTVGFIGRIVGVTHAVAPRTTASGTTPSSAARAIYRVLTMTASTADMGGRGQIVRTTRLELAMMPVLFWLLRLVTSTTCLLFNTGVILD